MDYTKEIRSGDKKRVKTGVKTPINRRPGWVPGGSVACWRMLGCWRMVWPAVVDGWRLMLQTGGCWAFWGPERQGGRAAAGGGGAVGGFQVSGVMVCRGWLCGGDPAEVCGGNSAVFNQLLTTIRCGAMDWCGSVFNLCISAIYRPPGGDSVSRGRGWGDGGPGRSGRQGGDTRPARGGVAEKGPASPRTGEEYCPTFPPPHHGLGGCRKTGRVVLWNPCRKLSGTCSLLFKISSFYSACFERNLWYFENRQNYTNPCSEVRTMPCNKKKGGRKGC